jgi:hypothetical protein
MELSGAVCCAFPCLDSALGERPPPAPTWPAGDRWWRPRPATAASPCGRIPQQRPGRSDGPAPPGPPPSCDVCTPQAGWNRTSNRRQWLTVPSILSPFDLLTVFRMHGILVWIRIRGSMPLTNESGPDADPDLDIFVIDLHDANKKLIKKKNSAYYSTFWRYIYTNFQR